MFHAWIGLCDKPKKIEVPGPQSPLLIFLARHLGNWEPVKASTHQEVSFECVLVFVRVCSWISLAVTRLICETSEAKAAAWVKLKPWHSLFASSPGMPGLRR